MKHTLIPHFSDQNFSEKNRTNNNETTKAITAQPQENVPFEADDPWLAIMANPWIFIHDHGLFNTLHTYSWKNIDDSWESDASWIFIHDFHP